MVHGEMTGPIVQIRRRVKAGAEQIFDLWTKPDLMVRWMSPFPGAVDCIVQGTIGVVFPEVDAGAKPIPWIVTGSEVIFSIYHS